jgi:hypothetical protein
MNMCEVGGSGKRIGRSLDPTHSLSAFSRKVVCVDVKGAFTFHNITFTFLPCGLLFLSRESLIHHLSFLIMPLVFPSCVVSFSSEDPVSVSSGSL